MILYDGNPMKGSGAPLAKFEGNRLENKDPSVFQSFERAKDYALKKAKREIIELEDKIVQIESVTVESCTKIRNPFD